MLTKTFYRWSALCTLLGAALLLTGYWLRTYIEKELIDNFATTQGLISSLLVAAGSLLLITGLPGIFARQAQTTGRNGLFASGLSLMGVAAFHLGTLALYFVLPVLVTHSPATRALLYSDVPPFPRFAIFWAVSLLFQTIGFIWLGIKSWKAGIYPKTAVLLLITGTMVSFCGPFLSFHLLKPGVTLMLAGLMGFAIHLLRSTQLDAKIKTVRETKRLTTEALYE